MNLLSSPQHSRGQPFNPLEWFSCNKRDSDLSIQTMVRRSSSDWSISRRTDSDTAPSSSHRPESADTTGSTLHRQRSSEVPPLRLQDIDPSPAGLENHSVNNKRNHVMAERAETVLPADSGTRISAAATASTATGTGFPGDVHDRRTGGCRRQASSPSLAPRSDSASSSSSKSAIAARASEWKRRIQERGLGAKAEQIVSDRPRSVVVVLLLLTMWWRTAVLLAVDFGDSRGRGHRLGDSEGESFATFQCAGVSLVALLACLQGSWAERWPRDR